MGISSLQFSLKKIWDFIVINVLSKYGYTPVQTSFQTQKTGHVAGFAIGFPSAASREDRATNPSAWIIASTFRI